MFLGTYQPNLIGKGRIGLPKKIREQISGNKIVLTIGFERCIFGFNKHDWEEITKPELARPLFSDTQARDLRRKMFMEAMEIDLGTQGRLVIPEKMTAFAGIKDRLVIIGAGDHFEVWNEKSWNEYQKKLS